VLPKALALLPMPNLWIFVFFITMVLLGIDSLFGMIEGIYTYLRDEFKQGSVELLNIDISLTTGKYMVLLLIMVGCPSLTSHAGIYYLEFYDHFISSIPFLLAGIVEIYVFVYLFKFSELEREIVKYTKTPTPFIIRFFLESKLLLLLLCGSLLIGFLNQVTRMLFS
jgi:SNF family Na+-dependent transporter